jgi:hypothetical protein
LANTGPAEGDPATGLPPGPGPAAAASSSPKPGGGQLTPSPAAGTEEAFAVAPAAPDGDVGGEAHKVTEALRAPLSAASSITTDVVDAVLGERATGPAGSTRRTGAGLAAALALTAVIARRRGVRHLPAAGATSSLQLTPEPLLRFFLEVPNESELFIPVTPRPRSLRL